jgi:lipopolysaccharide transport system ATP-binding protein
LSGDLENQNRKTFSREYDKPDFTLHQIMINPVGIEEESILDEFEEIEINTLFTLKNPEKRLHLTFVFNNEFGESLFTISHINKEIKLKTGINKVKCKLPKGFLNTGSYFISLYIIENAKTTLFVEKDIISFNIQEGERPIGSWMGKEPGFIKPIFDWSID